MNKELNNSNEKVIKSIIVDMLKYSTHPIEILNSYETKINLFKKINFTFQSLNKLIKLLLLRIDDKNYQMANDQKIIFPYDLNTLIVILGTFDRAFSYEHKQLLFNILTFPEYEILYKISNINSNMIPFVIDDQTDYSKINDNFKKFNILVTNFACNILNLNTEYEPHIIVDINTQEHTEKKNPTDDDREMILKNMSD